MLINHLQRSVRLLGWVSALALAGFQTAGAADADATKRHQDQHPEAKHAWKVTQSASSSESPANIMHRIDSYRRIEAEDFVCAKGAVIAEHAGARCAVLGGWNAFAAYPNVNLVMGRTKVKVRHAADRTVEMRVRLDESGGRGVASVTYQIADDSIPEAETEGGVFLIKRLTEHLGKVLFISNGTPNSFNVTSNLINGGEHSDNECAYYHRRKQF